MGIAVVVKVRFQNPSRSDAAPTVPVRSASKVIIIDFIIGLLLS